MVVQHYTTLLYCCYCSEQPAATSSPVSLSLCLSFFGARVQKMKRANGRRPTFIMLENQEQLERQTDRHKLSFTPLPASRQALTSIRQWEST